MSARRLALAALAALLAAAAPAEDALPPAQLARQQAEYQADARKTILELQPFRRTREMVLNAPGQPTATLVDLAPRINAWHLLTIDAGKAGSTSYHLENPDPAGQAVRLGDGGALELVTVGGVTRCEPLTASLEAARRSGLPYAPLCGDRLFLRNRVSGNQTDLERTTDFLRDRVWGGERAIGLVRDLFYRDVFLETGRPGGPGRGEPARDPDAPAPALMDPARASAAPVPYDLGLDLGRPAATLLPGRWYPVADLAGIYFSFVQPADLPADLLRSYPDRVNPLNPVEAGALDYLVAFDLARFDLGFALGTDHPRVDWSDRPPDGMRGVLPGPDGIGTVAPLVMNGMVSPWLVSRTVATFAGGFKRKHGAFKWGALSLVNHGSHYGFVEEGVILSKLQPGLATVYGLDDGTVGMKSWTAADDALLPRLRFARQNGVPLIDQDPAGQPVPGALVGQWGPGNWSGTAEEKLRSVRSGLCLAETPTRRFLVFGYFSAATPSALARVFQAYGCRYAFHLDMNALEHTYFALYRHRQGQIAVEHLVGGMAAVDKKSGDALLPRFLAYPDDRDLFYLTQRRAVP